MSPFSRLTLNTEQGPGSAKAILASKDLADLYTNFEKIGFLMRVDPAVEPTKMRAGTVSSAEMEKIRTIKDIVRKGRVRRLMETKIIFTNGEEVESQPETLYVDCSTNRWVT